MTSLVFGAVYWFELESNILYSDKNAFIRLPQLHIAGLLYSGLEPPISSKLLLPKLQYNLGSLMVSLDQGHNEIVLQSMVHVCPFKFRLGLHRLLEIFHWWFTCAPSISFHRPELHQCCPPLETCWTASILVSYSEITTESGLSCHPTILPSCTFRKMNVLTK